MRRTYTEQELARLHTELYDILGETIRVCKEYDIPYFLIGGTAIGALYDKGILPWDDDIDIGMTRDAYNRFLEVAPTALKPEYFLSWIGTDPHTPYYFAKVRKNNTRFVEELFRNIPMHHGIFIDIFPFDRLPNNPWLIKVHRSGVNFLKCCLLGKEIWLWKYFGKCETPTPTNRGPLPCLLNRLVDILFTKKMIYKMMVAVQSMFNHCSTTHFNNTVTSTDVVPEDALHQLDTMPFGPLMATTPHDVEHFLRSNYPSLHRFTPEEQAQITNHCPLELKFSETKT